MRLLERQLELDTRCVAHTRAAVLWRVRNQSATGWTAEHSVKAREPVWWHCCHLRHYFRRGMALGLDSCSPAVASPAHFSHEAALFSLSFLKSLPRVLSCLVPGRLLCLCCKNWSSDGNGVWLRPVKNHWQRDSLRHRGSLMSFHWLSWPLVPAFLQTSPALVAVKTVDCESPCVSARLPTLKPCWRNLETMQAGAPSRDVFLYFVGFLYSSE